MVLWSLFFLLNLELSIHEGNCHLVKIIVLFRHGARTPLFPFKFFHSYKNDENTSSEGYGQLTQIGKKQLFDLGQNLQERYRDFLVPRNGSVKADVQAVTTESERCYKSAGFLLTGLYPHLRAKQKWSGELNWQFIPVVFGSPDRIKIIANRHLCPIYYDELQAVKISANYSDPDIHYLLNFFSRHITSTTLNDVTDLFFLIDYFNTKEAIPEWIPKNIYSKMTRFYVDSFNYLTYTLGMRRLLIGPLIEDIILRINEAVYKKKSNSKFFFYSGHDASLHSLGRTLGLQFESVPYFGACIVFEIHQLSTNDFRIKLFYSPDYSLQKLNVWVLPGCEVLCPVRKFIAFTEKYIPSDWSKECNVILNELMLLTLYYMTSTCIQSWRFKSMKNSFIHLFGKGTSIVLYKEKAYLNFEPNGNNESLGLYLRGITSEYCSNKSEAHLLDLWCHKFEKRGCSILPVQTINISNWISIKPTSTYFPIRFRFNNELQFSNSQKISLLLEATFLYSDDNEAKLIHELEKYGLPKAWTTNEYFAIILETDLDNFARLSCEFMLNNLHLNDVMEIIRLETVDVLGNPCELVNADRIPILIHSLNENNNEHKTQSEKFQNNFEWETFHVQMLKKVARAAEELQSSGDTSLDLDYPPVTVTKYSFVKSNFTTPIDQVSISVVDQVDYQKKLSNSMPKYYNGETFSSPLKQHHDGPSSFSTASLYSINSAISESTASTRMLSVEELNRRPNSRTSISTADVVSLPDSTRCTSSPMRHQGEKKTGKPPNIIVFSESPSSVDSIKTSLNYILRKHRYTVYSLSLNGMLTSPWMRQASLVVLCGNVPISLKPLLLKYLLNYGGQLLCLCSDLLGVFLPTFKIAEVRPDEVVNFSYGKWNNIALLHHIFCYQPSPNSKFSMDESPSSNMPSPNIVPPTVELLDNEFNSHILRVKVLASEKTWQTPTLLLATKIDSEGKALFSQVHLEVDPPQNSSTPYDSEIRYEVLSDLVSNCLGLECDLSGNIVHYTPAYFLGRHERKSEFMKAITPILKMDDELHMKNVVIKFRSKNSNPLEASSRLLPLKLYECPLNFSTLEYFENLQTEHLGRLVVYSEIMTSSLDVLTGPVLEHGIVAISRQQTAGVGRGGNSWISPDGCAMFSIQLHVPLSSPLGQKLSLLQHIIALSIVSAIRSQPHYENLSLGLKWPNDIYAGGQAKIGGLIITSNISNSVAVCNAGCALNLSNSLPTTCVNDMIEELGRSIGKKLPKLSLEKYFALVFTQLEKLLDDVQKGGIDMVFDLYYKYWLHNFAEVRITKADGSSQAATIIGLDDFGFLKVRGERGEILSVQPDGNTFDMLSGLIAPK